MKASAASPPPSTPDRSAAGAVGGDGEVEDVRVDRIVDAFVLAVRGVPLTLAHE